MQKKESTNILCCTAKYNSRTTCIIARLTDVRFTKQKGPRAAYDDNS